MLHQTRISLLVVAIALLIFTSSANGQQCMSSVKNTAVKEGDKDTIMGLSTNPQNVSWKVQPTTNETDTYTIIDYDGVIDTTLIRLYDVNQIGLIIKEATIVKYGHEFPISTAGLYIGQCANNSNETGAKLLVVRKSPECSCTPINSTASTVWCKVTYADHSIQPIYPIVTWKLNGVFLESSTLQRTRVVDAYVFQAESTIKSDIASLGDYTCELTFSAPTVTDIQFAYVATNAPEFNESCSTSIVCGQKSTAPPTTTTQPTTTRKLMTTANKELSTSTTPPATTTQTPKTTQPSRTTATKILTAATQTPPPTSKSPTTATKGQTTTLRTLSKQMTQTSPKTSEPHITTPMKSRTATSLTTATTFKSSAVTADHLISTGSLTKNPINTAADAGSNNMTLECASIYGTNATRWSFIPLRSTTNETIYLSSGYQLFPTYEHTYELNATFNSSILIVRQLSNLTEGTYNCSDGTESASALLLVIPFQISVDPLFGPIAGGTRITIIGSTAIGYFSKYVDTNITGVRNVYIGKDFSSTSVSCLPIDSSTFEVVAVTPRTTLASIGQSLPIIIEFSPTSFNMSFNKFFVYLPNPVITEIKPTSFIVTGGTLIDVFGESLSSVAKPIIQLTVVITRANETNSTSNTTTGVCTVPSGNGTFMQCRMPPLYIPKDFLEILNLFYSASTIRKRRSRDPVHHLTANSQVNGSNGMDRADIYLGFMLDAYKEYESISDPKLVFYSPPEINSSVELIEFDPSQEELIYVKGRNMMRGCRLGDYVVYIGNQTCAISDLHDNQLSCRPPKVEPSPNDTIQCVQFLSILITIGDMQYQYACLKYTDRSRTLALIIGLTVGLAAFAFLVAILITVCIIRRRRKKVSQETDSLQHFGGVELRHPHEQPESQQNVNIIHKRENTITMYKPYDDYLPYLQPDSL